MVTCVIQEVAKHSKETNIINNTLFLFILSNLIDVQAELLFIFDEVEKAVGGPVLIVHLCFVNFDCGCLNF